jgi:hypothetical protein
MLSISSLYPVEVSQQVRAVFALQFLEFGEARLQTFKFSGIGIDTRRIVAQRAGDVLNQYSGGFRLFDNREKSWIKLGCIS